MRKKNKQLFFVLLILNGLFIAAHLLSHFIERTTTIDMSHLVQLFSMDIEYSLPSIFATLLLMSIGLTLFLIGHKEHAHKLAWFSLSGIFVYLSLDELLAIHERLMEPTQVLLNISSGPFFFAWIIPAAILLVFLALIYWRFLFALTKSLRTPLFIAAALFLAGAIGIEMISGAYWQAHNFDNTMTYRLLNALEEGLENTGSIIALTALLHFTKQKTT